MSDDDVLNDDVLDYKPISRRSIKLNLSYRGRLKPQLITWGEALRQEAATYEMLKKEIEEEREMTIPDQNITTDDEVIASWGTVQVYNLNSKQDRDHVKRMAEDVFCHWGDADNQEQRVAKSLLLALTMLPDPTSE